MIVMEHGLMDLTSNADWRSHKFFWGNRNDVSPLVGLLLRLLMFMSINLVLTLKCFTFFIFLGKIKSCFRAQILRFWRRWPAFACHCNFRWFAIDFSEVSFLGFYFLGLDLGFDVCVKLEYWIAWIIERIWRF